LLWTAAAQGEHEVKFLVDGKWRLAPHWPSVTNSLGDTNNVLVVGEQY